MRNLVRQIISEYEPALVAGEGLVPAAVLMLLYSSEGQEHLLFQVRTQHVEHHKGEVSLPGGARDPGDESLLATALRETHEEIGVAPHHIEVFGRLDDVVTRTNFVMAPYVGAITAPSPYDFRFAKREVELLLEVPLPHLLSGQSWEWAVNPLGQESRAYRFGEHLIFGATARIVSQFLDMLLPRTVEDGAGALPS